MEHPSATSGSQLLAMAQTLLCFRKIQLAGCWLWREAVAAVFGTLEVEALAH
jgi:hypothetical protein